MKLLHTIDYIARPVQMKSIEHTCCGASDPVTMTTAHPAVNRGNLLIDMLSWYLQCERNVRIVIV